MNEDVPQVADAKETAFPTDVRVFLVNQRDILRRGLHALIEESEDIVVTGEVTGEEPSPEAFAAADPDVVVVDAGGSHSDAIAVLKTLHDQHSDVPCLILDHSDQEGIGLAAIGVVGDGYLADDTSEGEVRDAMRRAAVGERRPERGTAAPAAALDHEGVAPPLTYREGQVLRLIPLGLTNRQIGDRLGLAEKTVKNYISTLLAKLHFERRTQAAVYQITHVQVQDPRRGKRDYDTRAGS